MSSEDKGEVETKPLGWMDLGRYFIFHSIIAIVFGVISSVLITAAYRNSDFGHWLTLIVWAPISLALYLTLKPRGHDAWRLLGFRSTEYYWYVTAFCGWIGLTIVICYGLPEIGKSFSGRGVFSGVFPEGRPVAEIGFRWLTILGLLQTLGAIVPTEIAIRGLALNALRTVWTNKAAIWTCGFLAIGSTSQFSASIGFVPAVTMIFLGGSFNGWLMVRSGSIWPGLMALIGFVAYSAFYLNRMAP